MSCSADVILSASFLMVVAACVFCAGVIGYQVIGVMKELLKK